jgi:predicted Zn-dependent peptidase
MWVIYGGVEPDMLRDSITTILDILRDIYNDGVTEEELTRVKEQVKGGILLSLEDTWSVASRNGAHQLRYNEVIPVERVVAEVEAVTGEDILRVARRLLYRDALHLAIIGPYGSEDQQEMNRLLATAFAA